MLVFIITLYVALAVTAPLCVLLPIVAYWLYSQHGFGVWQLLLYAVPVWFVLAGIISTVFNKNYNMYGLWSQWDRDAGVWFEAPLNWIFETKQYKFGSNKNTVSAILGANLHTRQARWWDWLFTNVADRSSLKNGSTHCYDSYKIELKRGYGVFAKQ